MDGDDRPLSALYAKDKDYEHVPGSEVEVEMEEITNLNGADESKENLLLSEEQDGAADKEESSLQGTELSTISVSTKDNEVDSLNNDKEKLLVSSATEDEEMWEKKKQALDSPMPWRMLLSIYFIVWTESAVMNGFNPIIPGILILATECTLLFTLAF